MGSMTLGLGRSTSSVCVELLCLLDLTEKPFFSMTAGLKGKKIEKDLEEELDVFMERVGKDLNEVSEKRNLRFIIS